MEREREMCREGRRRGGELVRYKKSEAGGGRANRGSNGRNLNGKGDAFMMRPLSEVSDGVMRERVRLVIEWGE